MSDKNLAALQAAVLSCLTDILGSEQQKITSAEAELKALEVTEEYGEVLASLTVSGDTPIQFRQLASVILKQYVERHWCEESKTFTEPIPGPQTKSRIRKLLPKGLGDSQSRIRATVAYAVSAIAHWDWPEEWPDLFDQLMIALASGDPCLVHGCMRVLQEFCHDVTDQQMILVAPIIFPQLLKIFVGSHMYGVRTRTRVVHIFGVLCNLIFTMADVYTEAPKTLLFPILPDFLAAFVRSLGSGDDEQSVDPGLRKELIVALCNTVRCFPRALTPHIMEIATPVWTILVSNTPQYVRSVVNGTECLAEVCDSDGDIITYQSTVFAIFEFISSLIENAKLRKILVPNLAELMYYIVAHLQITEEQVHSWLSDVNQFVNEDDNEYSSSVRLSALDLINSLCEEPAIMAASHSAVVDVVQRHLNEVPSSPGKDGCWWKIHEACFLTIGSVFGQTGLEQFDCHAFVERVLLPDLISGASPLLTGRCLWLGAKLASLMTTDTLRRLLEATGLCLQPSQHAVLRILATKAAYDFSTALSSSQLLPEYLPTFLDQLVDLASHCPEDVLPVVLDALCQVAKADKTTTGQFADRLVPLTVELFKKYSHDPGVSSCVEELFAVMAATPCCLEGLHSHFLPTAVHILQTPEAQLPAGILSATLDTAALLVRGCGDGVPDVLMTDLFPAVVQSILRTDDSAVIQSGGECIRAFISTVPELVSRWVDTSGRAGLHYVVQVILYMLDPSRPEFTASFVGKLLIVIVKKVGNYLGQYLELLLKAVLSKMQLVQTSTVMQSLLCVFAHLIQRELDAVLSFLLAIPDPSGKPALCFVLNQWCAGHSFFFGVYETRVSTLALCKLLNHCLTARDSQLAKLSVRVEEGVMSEAIFTRSRKAADERHMTTEVPLPVRLMKLVIADLQLQIEAKQAGNEVEEEDEYEDGDGEEWEDATPHSLESLLGVPGYVGYEYNEEEEDPDLKDEAILKIDMESHLAQCLRELSYTSSFPSIVSMLTDHEQQTLYSIGIQCK